MAKYEHMSVPATLLDGAEDESIIVIVDTDYLGNGTNKAVLRVGDEQVLSSILALLNSGA